MQHKWFLGSPRPLSTLGIGTKTLSPTQTWRKIRLLLTTILAACFSKASPLPCLCRLILAALLHRSPFHSWYCFHQKRCASKLKANNRGLMTLNWTDVTDLTLNWTILKPHVITYLMEHGSLLSLNTDITTEHVLSDLFRNNHINVLKQVADLFILKVMQKAPVLSLCITIELHWADTCIK